MRIKVDQAKCSGCHLCEMVCSLFHFGTINTEKAAVRIHKDDLCTSLNSPVLCRQCKKMKCLSREIISGVQERKKFIWKKTRAERCPHHALSVFGESTFHCDLCNGKPQCVKVCTSGALHILK